MAMTAYSVQLEAVMWHVACCLTGLWKTVPFGFDSHSVIDRGKASGKSQFTDHLGTSKQILSIYWLNRF